MKRQNQNSYRLPMINWLIVMMTIVGCFRFSSITAQETDNQVSSEWHEYTDVQTADYKRFKKEKAIDDIVKLRTGALLVRLKTRSKSIKAYKKSGATYVAKRMAERQLAENKKIREIFEEYYDFSAVYYFYTDDTDKLLMAKHEGIFLNDELKRDKSIELTADFFLIVD